VSEKNANSNVQLHTGDKFVVTLDGNPTTGYKWEVASSDAAILKQVGEAQFTPIRRLWAPAARSLYNSRQPAPGKRLSSWSIIARSRQVSLLSRPSR